MLLNSFIKPKPILEQSHIYGYLGLDLDNLDNFIPAYSEVWLNIVDIYFIQYLLRAFCLPDSEK